MNAAAPSILRQSTSVQSTHPTPRKYLELTQDVIVVGLCLLMFAAMGVKLLHLTQLMLKGTDFALVIGDILFILVLLELFRLLLIYLGEHRVSVATMVEVGIVVKLPSCSGRALKELPRCCVSSLRLPGAVRVVDASTAGSRPST